MFTVLVRYDMSCGHCGAMWTLWKGQGELNDLFFANHRKHVC